MWPLWARLTADEVLAVEKAVLRAYLDKIICVKDPGYWDFRAWDLMSGQDVGRPLDCQMSQLWLNDCQDRDALPSRETQPVIFCIYTYAMHEAGGMPIPADHTHVSFSAVEIVPEEGGLHDVTREVAQRAKGVK